MRRISFTLIACSFATLLSTSAFAAGSATLRASNGHIGKSCPTKVKFYGSIRSSKAGEVQYRFRRSDGALAPIQSIRFDRAGARRISTSWQLGRTYSGWQQIEILYPNSATSPKAAFDVRCNQGQGRADLKVTISGPNQARPGNDIGGQLQITARNRGNVAAGGSRRNGYMIDVFLSTDRIYPNGHAVYSTQYNEDVLLKGGRVSNTQRLAANSTKDYTAGGGIPSDTPDGEYWLCAKIDPGRKVPESSESNNVSCQRISIRRDRPVMPHVLKEDCTTFNPNNLRVKKRDGRYILEDNGHRVFALNSRFAAQQMKLTTIRYQANQSCFVGRPNPSFTYLLRQGTSFKGSIFGEDCNRFKRQNLKVRYINNRWKIVDGNRWLYDFGEYEVQARTSLKLIKKYRFNYNCFVGRPNGVGYLRR